MKLKVTKLILFVLIIGIGLFIGCATEEPTDETPDQETPGEVDEVTTASIANDEASFLKAISEDGTWIIITEQDLEIDSEIVLEGEFENRDVLARKIALYAQDEDRNVTARYTLTAPKLTVKSENARIQGGTFVGDVYVEADGFSVVDATVEGNVYFANEQFESTFKLENEGSVTGTTEVKE